jgi:hypothetical protein
MSVFTSIHAGCHEGSNTYLPQNFLTIDFALLDFSNQQQTNYYDRMDR